MHVRYFVVVLVAAVVVVVVVAAFKCCSWIGFLILDLNPKRIGEFQFSCACASTKKNFFLYSA